MDKLVRAHLCNTFEIEYMIATCLIANRFNQSDDDAKDIFAIVADTINTFRTSYVVARHDFERIYKKWISLGLSNKYTGLSSELAWIANIDVSEKLEILVSEFQQIPNLRNLARIDFLKRQLKGSVFEKYNYNRSSLFPIKFRSGLPKAIHISPYQSMSLGHMVFYAYALAATELRSDTTIYAWSINHLNVCPELLEAISKTQSRFIVCSQIWEISQSSAIDALNTDHLFHFKNYVYPIESIPTYNLLTSSLRTSRGQIMESPSIFCHVRTSDFKNDKSSAEASLRNSDPQHLINALDVLFPDSMICITAPGSFASKSPARFIFEDSSTSVKRNKQLFDLFSSDILVAPSSGFSLFASYGPQKLWYHNSTNLLTAYPLPCTHLISPKRLRPKAELSNLTASEKALILLYGDYNSLFSCFELIELSESELIEEGNLFKRCCSGAACEKAVDIIDTLFDIAQADGLNRRFKRPSPRWVSNATKSNFMSILLAS